MKRTIKQTDKDSQIHSRQMSASKVQSNSLQLQPSLSKNQMNLNTMFNAIQQQKMAAVINDAVDNIMNTTTMQDTGNGQIRQSTQERPILTDTLLPRLPSAHDGQGNEPLKIVDYLKRPTLCQPGGQLRQDDSSDEDEMISVRNSKPPLDLNAIKASQSGDVASGSHPGMKQSSHMESSAEKRFRHTKDSPLYQFIEQWFAGEEGLKRPRPTKAEMPKIRQEFPMIKDVSYNDLKMKMWHYVHRRQNPTELLRAKFAKIDARKKLEEETASRSKKPQANLANNTVASWLNDLQQSILSNLTIPEKQDELSLVKKIFACQANGIPINDWTEFQVNFLKEDGTMVKYVSQFTGETSDNQAKPFHTLSNKLKLEAWLRTTSIQLVNRTNITRVCKEIESLLNKLELKDFDKLQFDRNAPDFIVYVLNSLKANKSFEFKLTQFVLLAKLRRLRDFVLQFLVSEIEQDTDILGTFGVSQQHSDQITEGIRDLLKAQYKLSDESAETILTAPKELFWEEALEYLSTSMCKNELVQIWQTLNLGQDNPARLIKDLVLSAAQCDWVASYLTVFDSKQLGSYGNVIKFLDEVNYKPRPDVMAILNSKDISDYGSHYVNQVRGAQNVDQDAMQENNEIAFKLAIQDGLKEEFGLLCQISIQMAQSSRGAYTHSGMLVYFAVKAVKDQHRVVGVQLDSGNGKSFLIILMSIFYTRILKKKCVISSWNDSCLAQMREKQAIVRASNVNVVGIQNLKPYIDSGEYVFLIDEYHWCITNTPFKLNSHSELPLLHRLGKTSQMRIFSATTSTSYNEFCEKHFVDFCLHTHGKVMKAKKCQNDLDFTVHCFQSAKEMTIAAKNNVATQAKSCPQICFGIETLDDKVKELPGIQIYRAETDKEGVDVSNSVLKKDRGIVLLNKNLACGLDVKFLEGAEVTIVSEQEPDIDVLKQMIGRGSRHLNDYKGILFTCAGYGDPETLKRTLLNSQGVDFKDGALIIDLIQRRAQRLNSTRAVNRMLRVIGEYPWMKIDEFVDHLEVTDGKWVKSQLDPNKVTKNTK